jgi:hypothetical protein
MTGAEKGSATGNFWRTTLRKTTLLAGLAGITALGALGAGVLSAAPPPPPLGDLPAGMAWEARAGHWGRGPHMGPAFCGPARDERLDRLVDMVEGFANFTPEQEPAWVKLRDSVRSASGKLDTACNAMRDAGRDATPPARLAGIETMLGAGLEAVREVRPSFDAFYATLNDRQKAALDRLIEGHRRH